MSRFLARCSVQHLVSLLSHLLAGEKLGGKCGNYVLSMPIHLRCEVYPRFVALTRREACEFHSDTKQGKHGAGV